MQFARYALDELDVLGVVVRGPERAKAVLAQAEPIGGARPHAVLIRAKVGQFLILSLNVMDLGMDLDVLDGYLLVALLARDRP